MRLKADPSGIVALLCVAVAVVLDFTDRPMALLPIALLAIIACLNWLDLHDERKGARRQ